jgi:hypothetical protein
VEVSEFGTGALEGEALGDHEGGLASGVATDGGGGGGAGGPQVLAHVQGQGLATGALGGLFQIDGRQPGADLLVDRVAHLSLALQILGPLGGQSGASLTGGQLIRKKRNFLKFNFLKFWRILS